MNHFVATDVEVYAHQRTKKGNDYCGDSYFYTNTEEYFICVLADGLGSGENAFDSSTAVISVVEKYHHEDVEALMKRCNEMLVEKRGAAVAIFKVYFSQKEFVYSCVGNIRFYLYSSSGQLTYPVPVTGYLSGKPQNFRTQSYPYEENSKFLLYSDGFRFQGLKNMLSAEKPLKGIAEDIKRKPLQISDDATFIIGALL